MALARDTFGVALGAALGYGAGEVTRKLSSKQAVIFGAVGLVTAAVIYPAARRSFGTGGVFPEVAAIAATTGIGAAAARMDTTAGRRLVAATVQQLFEPMGVQCIVIDNQAVATWRGLDRRRTHRPTQPHHAALHDLAPRLRWRIAPERVGEPLGCDRIPGAHGQDGEHDPVVVTKLP